MLNHKLINLCSILILGFLNHNISGQKSETSLHIDSVSVTEETDVAIGWAFESDITEGYFVLHRRMDNVYDSIAAIDNFDIDFFVDTLVNASDKPYSYYISARKLKEDGTYESFASSKAHQTIFIEDLAQDVCKENINIQWSNYVVTTTVHSPDTLEAPFDSTIVMFSYENEGFETADTLSIKQDSTSFPASKPGEYCFKLRSFDSENPSHTSTSNIRCISATTLEPPEFAYLRKASVIDNAFIRLSLYVDSTISNPAYVIHKDYGQNEDFSPVDTINSGKANITYDDDADIFTSAHDYYFTVLDSCRMPVKNSNTVSSLFLHAVPLSNNENLLQWNIPEGFPGGVERFVIRRKTGQDDDFETIALVPGYQDYYNDIFSTDNQDLMLHEYIYKIKAIEASQNPFGFKDTVYSNHAEAVREIEIFIPNAFKPESTIEQNRVFKPVIRNARPRQYRMMIYNNWGQIVFRTEDHDVGWNGNINGKRASAGIYLYEISFRTDNGKTHNKKGTVNLIR